MFVNSSEISIDSYDVIVAGSGLASYSLSDRLNAAGKRVLILETGQRAYDGEIQAAFTKMYGRGHFDGRYWPQHWIRTLGGTSSVWAGWCTALSDRNLKDWPLSRRDLDPHYRFAAGLLRRPDAFLAFSAPFVEGFTFRPKSIADPVNLNAEPELFERLERVDVALGATLAGLVPAGDRRAVAQVSVHAGGELHRHFDLRPEQSVVLAAGGMGNAQILLCSGHDANAAVGNENDQLGRYLMEHPHVYEAARIIGPEGFELPAPPGDFGEHAATIEPDDGLYEDIGEIDVSLTFEEASLNAEDPVESFLVERIGPGARAHDLTIRSEMSPLPDNRVRLGEGFDPSGLTRLRSVCYVGADSMHAVDACLVRLAASLRAAGPARVRIVNDKIVRDLLGGGHTMGTTRMGVSPRDSVVDLNCRVHGYRNLFVAGSSVFRTGGYANPTLTIVALAARLGDFLGKQA